MKAKMRAIQASLLVVGLAAVGTVVASKAGVASQTAPDKVVKGRTVTVDDSANKTRLALRKGDRLVVRLVSNVSTGFSWQISRAAEKQLMPVSKPIYENAPRKPGGPPIVGAPGHQVFTFDVKSPGNVVLEFEYKQPWAKQQPPVRTYHLDVVVSGA